jgi:hypothetical protein
VPEDTFFGKPNINTVRVNLLLVIGFAVVGVILLVLGITFSFYGFGNGSGPGLAIFGVLFLFTAYLLGVEFGFLEGYNDIFSGP